MSKSKISKKIKNNFKVKRSNTYLIKKSAFSILLTVTLLLSVLLSGCAGAGREQASAGSAEQSATSAQSQSNESSAVAEQASASSQQDTANNKFPLKVTDANGFEMTIQSEPRHIVSLTLGTDEILLGLVDKSRILALTRYADDSGISNIAADAAAIKERATMDQLEKIIALKPDLVILDTWADAKYVSQLRDAGITVYAFKTPSNLVEQKTVITEIANITGTDEKGQEMVAWMDAKLKEVEDKLAALKPENKLTVMDYGELGSSGKGTNFDDIVTRAGLVNVVSRAGMEGWPVVPKEKIIEFNPDIIILPSWYYDQKNSLQGMIDKLKGDKSLEIVKAIKNEKLISIPNPHISAISQYVVLAVEDVAKAAYPDLFK